MNHYRSSRLLILTFVSLFAGLTVHAQAPAAVPAETQKKLGSTFFKFEDLAVKPSGVGERRDVARNPTATLREFECHISTLNPSMASHPPHTHPQEELIILRDGELDVHINGNNTRIGPGTLFFFASNDPHAVQNHGSKPATYFVFNFTTAATLARRGQPRVDDAPGRLGSTIFNWDKLKAKPNKTGARRVVTDLPTLTLANLEAHITTLNAGESSGTPHSHAEELVLLVKEGQVEVAINDRAERLGVGSIVFIATGDTLGVKNTGVSAATYYILNLRTEATPATVALK